MRLAVLIRCAPPNFMFTLALPRGLRVSPWGLRHTVADTPVRFRARKLVSWSKPCLRWVSRYFTARTMADHRAVRSSLQWCTVACERRIPSSDFRTEVPAFKCGEVRHISRCITMDCSNCGTRTKAALELNVRTFACDSCSLSLDKRP